MLLELWFILLILEVAQVAICHRDINDNALLRANDYFIPHSKALETSFEYEKELAKYHENWRSYDHFKTWSQF